MPSLKTKSAVVVAAAAVVAGLLTGGGRTSTPLGVRAGHSLTPMQLRLISGTSEHALINLGVLSAEAARPDQAGPGGDSEGEGTAAGTASGGAITAASSGGSLSAVFPGKDGLCAQTFGSNVRANTACTNYADRDLHGRSMAQNETSIAVSPTDKDNLVGSSNDYSRGDGNCGSYYSNNGGKSWNGTTAPMLFVRGKSLTPGSGNTRQYWQAGGDTEVAFDSKGTAYLQCQVFNRGAVTTQDPDVSSGILFFRSANGGASWDFPGRVAASSYETSGAFPNGVILEDKPFFAIDNHPGSAHRDRIYMTWTSFTADGNGYINETQSSDGGETWTARRIIGGVSPSLCPTNFGTPTTAGGCNQNQFSDPFVGQDGTLHVVFSNFNNATVGNDNRNQVLEVNSTDGGATFTAPIKVTDYYDLPDCLTYTGKDAFRACVVNKGTAKTSVFRAANYPSGAVDPTNASHVVVNIGSYINKVSNETTGCAPAGFSSLTGINLFIGAGTQACNNQILQSASTDGGATFTGTTTDPLTLPLAGKQETVADEFWQWTGFTSKGTPVVGYYDRQYGDDNAIGNSDYSVAAANEQGKRVTTVASPPPTEFGGTFYGDYNQLAVAGDTAYVSWTDDRNPGITSCKNNPDAICILGHDEDMFMAAVKVDNGGAG